MKDNTISYDLVHHHQHHQQQHQWNQQGRQQHQTHTTNVYHGTASTNTEQSGANSQNQRSAAGSGGGGGQQQQQHPQLSQYHQQLQSSAAAAAAAAHHNPAAAAAASYYQQAHHLYSPYQTHTQDQQAAPGQQAADQHHPGSSVAPSEASPSVVNAAVVAAAQQQQHHQQAANNTQAAALNHAGWSPGLGSMGHHAVVTDHSTLAYMTHAYQSHNSAIGDPHRTNNGPMSTQPIGTGHQASSYGVGTMYNTPAAAAVAAYGYNNYDAAFFQTSNNGPHTQTGHPSSANMSTFWNHNQTSQPRATHQQAVSNQAAAVQQRQPIVSEQATNYMHDPRLYYGRPATAASAAAYNQGLQNFGQTQHHSQAQQQADVLQHRMTALSQQQHQLIHHEQQQLHQVAAAHPQQQLHHQLAVGGHHQQATTANQQSLLNQQQHNIAENPLSMMQSNSNLNAGTRQNSSPIKAPAQNQAQSGKQTSLGDSEPINQPVGQARVHHDYDPPSAASKQQSTLPANAQATSQTKDLATTNSQNSQSISKPTAGSFQKATEANSLSHSTNNATSNSQAVIKNDALAASQYQRKPQSINEPQMQNRGITRSDDRVRSKIDSLKKQSNDNDLKNETKSLQLTSASKGQESELEDDLGSLSLGSRKTTWASIASQPAKVSQPKSLKSKIAGSNSVLSSAKHLAAVSLDTTSLDSKNGINPAIKSSVSAAATSIQRNSVPPPISKVPSAVTSLKLNLLGDTNSETSRISWPAMNASVNLSLDDPPLRKETPERNSSQNDSEKSRKDDGFSRPQDYKDSMYKDHNHNQGTNNKMVNSFQHPPNRDPWSRRDQQRDQRDYRIRRDSDRREYSDSDKRMNHIDESRDQRDMYPRRDFKSDRGRVNYRGDDHYRDRDFKRGPIQERHDPRANDSYNQRFPSNRHEPRDSHHSHPQQHPHGRGPEAHTGCRNNDAPQTQHHHYNNVRDGHPRGNSAQERDSTLHPHLNPANYNPKNFNLEPENARYFIIKSYSEDDIHRSIKYSIWCSTNHGNKKLDEAYMQQQPKGGPIYLFFSVNSSGHFCGMAQMMSAVDFDSSSGVWAQSKWQGEFSVKWIYVKDVPNISLRHITLENNEDKPVTNSRDTQEVPSEKGKAVLRIIHQYAHKTSLFDDFLHYERRQEEEKFKKSHAEPSPPHRSEERERGPMVAGGGDRRDDRDGGSRFGRPHMNPHNRPHNDFPGHRERSSRFAS